MKSISKVLSMILVVVMCFGLFTTSAFATSMANFDFGGGSNAAQSNTAGGGFDFNPVGSDNSASNGSGGFDFGGQQSQPVNFDPQPAATTSSGNDTTVTNSLSTGESTAFGAPKPAGKTWKFIADKELINKSMTEAQATIKITCPTHGTDFSSDTFDAGFGYSTKSNGADMINLTNGVDYTIEPGTLTLHGSWVKTLAIGSYYIFGLSTNAFPNQMVYITVNPGSFGTFTMYGDHYNKNSTSVVETSAGGDMSAFYGYGVVGVSDSSYKKVLTRDIDYTSDNSGVWLKAGYLNALADGTYTLVGFTTPSDFNKDQVVIGNFYIESQTSDLPAFNIGNGSYDKSNANRQEVYAQATTGGAIGRVTGVEISGPTGSKKLSSGEYTIHGDATGKPGYVTISRDVLDTLSDGNYYFILYASSGLATIQKNVGSFTVTSGSVDVGDLVIANSPYDKSDVNRKAVGAVPKTTGVVANITGVAISGPETRTLASTEYFKQADSGSTPGYVVILKDVLDKLPDGTYNFLVTITSGITSVQKNAGQFIVKSGLDDTAFTIANSPYDKNSEDRKAVGAVPKTTGVVDKITGVAISGPQSRTLASSEFFKQADSGSTPGYVVILKDVLDKLPDGTYDFAVTMTSGISTVTKTAGQFTVMSGTIAGGQFEITNSPFDKNADTSANVVATAKENGASPALSDFSVVSVSTTASQTLKSSDYTYTDGTASSPRKVELQAAFLKTLADGDYYLYANAKSGVGTTRVLVGIFSVKTGAIPFGTFTMNPDTYDKNAENPTEVKATGSEADMKKLTGFSVVNVGGASTTTRPLSSGEYTKDTTSITIKASVLGTLPDGEYKLLGTATTGLTTEQVTIGIFYVKSGDVETGKYMIAESPYDKNKADRKEIYVDRTVAADPRFKANSFSIVGVTNTSFSQILNVNQYTVNNTTGVISPWITLKKNVLDTLPDGNYKIVCSATIGNVNTQVDLGVFTVVSGEVDFGSYAIHKSPYDKNSDSAEPIFAQETHNWGMLQYFSGYAISGITNPSYNQVLIGSQYSVNDAKTKVTISESVLKALPDGDYNFLGFATIGQASSQVNFGMFTIKSDYGEFSIKNSPYDKNLDGASPIIAVEVTAGAMKRMNGFGVASVNGSYAQSLSVNNYTRSGDGKGIALETRYLDTLEDGQYYLIGFPTLGSTSTQVILGTFTVRSGYYTIVGTAALTPGEQVWYSGSDPLTFYSEIHDLAGKGWNYKPYEWDTIVPDIRVSTYSDMRSPTSVRIDQYWDLNYGYIMLGANYLNSLSAEHTYYMQVIDARHPDILYSDVVSFRVGPTLRALDTDKHVINSTRSLRFRCSEPISRVYVGNIELTDPADFGVSWDGRTVTLSFEFLNKRTGGNTYTIKVLTTGGEYASTTFQVLTTAQGSASPRTGDESNLGLWAAFLLLSGTAVVVLVPKLKKHSF